MDALPGDRVPGAVSARLESYRSACNGVVRSFALTEGAEGREGGGGAGTDGEQKAGGGGGGGGGGGDGVFQWDSAGMDRSLLVRRHGMGFRRDVLLIPGVVLREKECPC